MKLSVRDCLNLAGARLQQLLDLDDLVELETSDNWKKNLETTVKVKAIEGIIEALDEARSKILNGEDQ